MGQLIEVTVEQVRENPIALRGVNRKSEKYLGLVDSMRIRGFMGTITARERTDPESKKPYYELIDGLHRFCAARDAGLKTVKLDVLDLNDEQVLEAQLMANIHKIETRPHEYSKQLERILVRNPMMTELELANRLGKSLAWIRERLGLVSIENVEVQTLINEGRITLTNAYNLAKLPPNEQAEWVDRAITLPPNEFVPQVAARVKSIRDAKRKGRSAAPAEFQPVPFLRKIGEIKAGLDNPIQAKSLLKDSKISDPVEAFLFGIKWCLNLDPQSIAAQRIAWDERAKKREELKQKAKEERARKKEEAASEAVAAVS